MSGLRSSSCSYDLWSWSWSCSLCNCREWRRLTLLYLLLLGSHDATKDRIVSVVPVLGATRASTGAKVGVDCEGSPVT